jgi:hypothetical protein
VRDFILATVLSAMCARGQGSSPATVLGSKAARLAPDLSGTWQLDFGPYFFNVREGLDSAGAQPWAEKIRQQRLENFTRDRWTITCLPAGPALGLDRQIAKIVQTPSLIIILYEDLTYRQIFLDGRQPPSDPNPSWMGYSTGQWEGDTLVVESLGFNDRTWLDYSGNPHSEALRIEERYRRVDHNHISLDLTYNDPGAYAKPWTLHTSMILAPAAELIEYVCAETVKDRFHIVGKLSDGAVTVPTTVLAKYAGAYMIRGKGPMRIQLEDDHLTSDYGGKVRLTAQNETTFVSPKSTFLFVMDAQGAVMRVLVESVEGELIAVRQQ